MKLLQLYYTSCKQGSSPGAGFQVYSASEGLTKEEIMELEQRSSYIPPTHLPSQPSEEEIRHDFPISFSSFRLKSGRYGVIQSVYIGKDYSGRFGNYFTHALVLETGTWPFATSLLYGAPIFKTSLTEEEENIERKPEPLPLLEISKPNGSLSLALVQNFLNDKDRYTYLKDIINGLIERNGQAGSIVLADNPKYVPYWIAAIQFAFPIQIANEISFSTYSFDPASENNVLSVTLNEGTRFSFQDIGRRYKLYGFNFITNQFSEPSKAFRYTEYVIQHQLQTDFIQTFANHFTLTKPTKALDAFIDLYTILHAESFSDASRIQNAFEFASNNLKPDQANELIDALSVDKLTQFSNDDIKSTAAIADFLIKISNQTNDVTHEQLAAQFILDKSIDLATDFVGLNEIELFITNHMNMMNRPTVVHDIFLLDEQLDKLRNQLSEMGKENINQFFLQLALKFIVQSAKQWGDLTDKQQLFLHKLTSHILSHNDTNHEAATLFQSHPKLFGYIARTMYEDETNYDKSLIENLMKMTKQNRNIPDWLSTYYNVLNETKAGEQLLHEEFNIRFKTSTEINDMTHVLLDASNVPTLDITPFILTYVDKLFHSEEKFIDNIQQLLQNKEIYQILDQEKILLDILDKGQQHIIFSDTAIEAHLQTYEQFIAYYKKKNIDISMYELVVVTFKTKGHRRKHIKELEKLLLAMLTNKKYPISQDILKNYLDWALPEVMHILYDNKKTNDELIEVIMYTNPTIVLHALTNRRQKLKVKYTDHLLVDLFIGYHKQGTKQALYDEIVHYLLENDYQHKKVQELLENEPELIKSWEKMHEDIQQKKGNPIFRSIKKLFKS